MTDKEIVFGESGEDGNGIHVSAPSEPPATYLYVDRKNIQVKVPATKFIAGISIEAASALLSALIK